MAIVSLSRAMLAGFFPSLGKGGRSHMAPGLRFASNSLHGTLPSPASGRGAGGEGDAPRETEPTLRHVAARSTLTLTLTLTRQREREQVRARSKHCGSVLKRSYAIPPLSKEREQVVLVIGGRP